MALTVLSVAYPLAPVSRDAAGGAEQVLAALDRGLVAAGHRSLVVAQEGSEVAGTLLPVPAVRGPLDADARSTAQCRHRHAIRSALAAERVDVVHLHGVDFEAYLPPPGPPVLATLHLPPDWYGPDALSPDRPDTWLHCVSDAQHAACPPSRRLLDPIPNGIDVAAFSGRHAKRRFALVLGRICPEKGVHLAMDAARLAGTPLVVAGPVFGYPAHRAYLEAEIVPRLDGSRRYVGPVGFVRKRRLLGAARCLVVPSLAPETSSLVAREALAAGTPVVGFDVGALAEVVEAGRTGFLVPPGDVAALARAIGDAARLDPDACREAARARFGEGRMIAAYLDRYRALAEGRAA